MVFLIIDTIRVPEYRLLLLGPRKRGGEIRPVLLKLLVRRAGAMNDQPDKTAMMRTPFFVGYDRVCANVTENGFSSNRFRNREWSEPLR